MAVGASHLLNRQFVRELCDVGMTRLAAEHAVNRRAEFLRINAETVALLVHKTGLAVAAQAVTALEGAGTLCPAYGCEHKHCNRHSNAPLPSVHVEPSFPGD